VPAHIHSLRITANAEIGYCEGILIFILKKEGMGEEKTKRAPSF